MIDKTLLRTRARLTRRYAHQALSVFASTSVVQVFFDHFSPPPGSIIAGYWPCGTELDIRILLNQLADKGYNVALPCIDKVDHPLVFRRWMPGTPLDNGHHNILIPPAENPIVIPDIVLVPLLAFDHHGMRLGNGGGYYDRTLAALRCNASYDIPAVGIAYSTQKLPAIPAETHDIPLDWIVTETYAQHWEHTPPASI